MMAKLGDRPFHEFVSGVKLELETLVDSYKTNEYLREKIQKFREKFDKYFERFFEVAAMSESVQKDQDVKRQEFKETTSVYKGAIDDLESKLSRKTQEVKIITEEISGLQQKYDQLQFEKAKMSSEMSEEIETTKKKYLDTKEELSTWTSKLKRLLEENINKQNATLIREVGKDEATVEASPQRSVQQDLGGKFMVKTELGEDSRKIYIHKEDYDKLMVTMQEAFRGKWNANDEILISYRDEDGDLKSICVLSYFLPINAVED